MKLAIIILSLITFYSCSHRPNKRIDKLSIIQGLTSSREVEFSVLASKNGEYQFELRDPNQVVINPTEVKKIERPFSEWAIYKILFQRDQLKDYNFFAFNGKKLIDQRLIGKGQAQPSQLKLVIASCMDDGKEDHFKIWDAIKHKNPEYLLLIGDNVYADQETSGALIDTDPESLWRRYVEVRQTLPIFFQEKLIPIHALWDDHDFGKNDGNSEYKYKHESKEIFDAFYAQSLSEDNWTKSFGIGGLLSLGDFNLYFLDARMYRSSYPEGTQLGIEQQDWLMRSLKNEIQPSFLIKGDQFFGGYHKFESYEGNHPNEFSNFIDNLKKLGTPITFISGDRHLSEVMQFPRSLFGLPTFEITSSPIHSKLFPGSELKNPWRVVHNDSQMNFTYIENTARDNHWFMDLENINDEGAVVYRRELAVYIKDLQNNLNEARKRRSGRRRSRSYRRR